MAVYHADGDEHAKSAIGNSHAELDARTPLVQGQCEDHVMSTSPESASAHWKITVAVIEARIEDLKARSDTEYQALHRRLDAQIAELQRELKKLAAEVAMAGPDAYMQSITAQLDALNAKGDAAYELLQSRLASSAGSKAEGKMTSKRDNKMESQQH